MNGHNVRGVRDVRVVNSYLPGVEYRKPVKHRTPTAQIGIVLVQWLLILGALATAVIVAVAPQSWINRLINQVPGVPGVHANTTSEPSSGPNHGRPLKQQI